MTEEFDLVKVLEGMSTDDINEYMKSQLNPETRQRFLAKRQADTLQRQYQQEMDNLNLKGLPHNMKLKKMVQLKEKYRAKGLQVF
jgi:hypothetical protein